MKGTVKAFSSFGFFANINNEIDSLCHLMEISWQRVNDPQELLSIGQTVDLQVIEIDKTKGQISTSIRALTPDPWEKISEVEVGKDYDFKCEKITEYGAFMSLNSLQALLHQSEISWIGRNVLPKKYLQVGSIYKCRVTEINQDKRRISCSLKLTQMNPFMALAKEKPVGSILTGEVSSTNEYAIYIKLDGYDIISFCHMNDLIWEGDAEAELKKYKIGQKISVKILEIDEKQQKCRAGVRQLKNDPFDFFSTKKVNDIISSKIIEITNKGLLVQPIGSEVKVLIKKAQIALAAQDSRVSRFVGGEVIDSAIQSISFENRKVQLSIKLLEELQNAEAITKYSSPLSGKQLPFETLSDKLKKKDKEKK